MRQFQGSPISASDRAGSHKSGRGPPPCCRQAPDFAWLPRSRAARARAATEHSARVAPAVPPSLHDLPLSGRTLHRKGVRAGEQQLVGDGLERPRKQIHHHRVPRSKREVGNGEQARSEAADARASAEDCGQLEESSVALRNTATLPGQGSAKAAARGWWAGCSSVAAADPAAPPQAIRTTQASTAPKAECRPVACRRPPDPAARLRRRGNSPSAPRSAGTP